jgi:hypothetical protein
VKVYGSEGKVAVGANECGRDWKLKLELVTICRPLISPRLIQIATIPENGRYVNKVVFTV